MKKLNSKTIPISKVNNELLNDLFQLFCSYYDNITFSTFERDIREKDRIIILSDLSGVVRGFSTLVCFRIKNNKGRWQHIIYSGDTIIEKSYWGTSALTMEFLKNIIKEKVKHPLANVWWFLISKGYKTYLLMAHNFHEYYPRYDRETPKSKLELLKNLSEKLYPGYFNLQTGIIEFKESDVHDKLKDFVAPITDEMCAHNPHVAFFRQKNPHWSQGHELACIGKVSFLLGITHPLKVLKKRFKKNQHSRVNAKNND